VVARGFVVAVAVVVVVVGCCCCGVLLAAACSPWLQPSRAPAAAAEA
jgi:hypothetical protein